MIKMLVVLLLLTVTVSAQDKESLNIDRFYEGHNGCFVCYNKQSGEYFRYNTARCKQRFLPASTFKIPNSLIGLETKIIADGNFVIKWDGVERQIKEWNRDQTLSSAIQYSVVPYYQELARRVGKTAMQKFLNELDYGNKTIGDAIDRFWLDNSLKISADEQVDFLKKLYDYKLNISKRSIDIVKKIIPQEKYDKSLLKFKTGTGSKEDNTYIGWLVGYVEKENNVYFYAYNIEAKTYDEVKQLRDTKSREILKYLKIVE
jgi:beta-lactamase class D